MSSVLYSTALSWCKKHGMRLCKASEVNQCCGAACGQDSKRVWTSTACDALHERHYHRSKPPKHDFTAVKAGTDFGCGLDTDKAMRCWGKASSGQTSPPPQSTVTPAEWSSYGSDNGDGLTARVYVMHPVLARRNATVTVGSMHTYSCGRLPTTIASLAGGGLNSTLDWTTEGDTPEIAGSEAWSHPSGHAYTSHYVVQWDGYLRVATPGAYTFSTVSSGASFVYIGGSLLVNNSQCHGVHDSGPMARNLTAGFHAVKVQFWQWDGSRNGTAKMALRYTGPDQVAGQG